MAIYHLSVKPISRTDGRSATAAAAYRAAAKISDARTGVLHDYTRKQGVVSVTLITPKLAPKWASDRSQVWNAAECAETRKNATVAREFEIALPAELSGLQRQQLAHELAQELVNQHGCIADVAIHEPSGDGDQRNHHAHILLSTRRLGPEGFTDKTRELDDYSSGPKWVHKWRERYAQLQNRCLRQAGSEVRVDHRSHQDRGVEAIPSVHLGPAATAYERRTGLPSRKRLDWQEHAHQRLLAAKEAGDLARAAQQLGASILVLDGDLQAALAERDAQPILVSQADIDQGRLAFRNQFALDRQQRQQKMQEQKEAAQQLERDRLAAEQRMQAEAAAKRLQQQREAETARQRRQQEMQRLRAEAADKLARERDRLAAEQRMQAEAAAKRLQQQREAETARQRRQQEMQRLRAEAADKLARERDRLAAEQRMQAEAAAKRLQQQREAETARQRRQQEMQRLRAEAADKLARERREAEQAVQRQQQQIKNLSTGVNNITQALCDGLSKILRETEAARQASLDAQSALMALKIALKLEALRRSWQLDAPIAPEPAGDVGAATQIDVLAQETEPELQPAPQPEPESEPEPQPDRGYDGPGF